MHLSDLLTPAPWAIVPHAMESLCNAYNQLASGGLTEASKTALPSSRNDGDGSFYLYQRQGNVAVIETTGVIHRRSGSVLCFSWDGQDQLRGSIDYAMTDPEVKALLLSFDSPGGVAAGVKELADHIAAQTAKPVYAYADGLCASAAYWLASATGKLYAPSTATIGSIGVIQVHCDRSGANTAEGLRYTYITGGTWKAAGREDAPLSGADQAYLQGMVDQLHSIFKTDVAARMGVDASQSAAWGDGQVFLAAEALELGLISGIVSDRETLIAQINKETSMDKEQLAREHPELLAELKAEARSEFMAEADSRLQAALDNQLALTRMVAGETSAEKVLSLSKAGLTADQVAALGSLGFQHATSPAENAEAKDAGSRGEILAALREATPNPVAAAAQLKEPDAMAAAIERISACK